MIDSWYFIGGGWALLIIWYGMRLAIKDLRDRPKLMWLHNRLLMGALAFFITSLLIHFLVFISKC
jgi:hypothetical protein